MLKKIIVIAPVALLLSGCASPLIPLPQSSPPPFKSASLEIQYSAEGKGNVKMSGIEYEIFTLECPESGEPSGTHPDPISACNHLAENTLLYQKKSPENLACTMIYGGPQEAIISGFINGREVAFSLDRSNGCAISEWESWIPVVPAGEMIAYPSEI